jgi:chromosome segregation ATPase
LDEHFAGLERIGEKIKQMPLKSESDQEQMRKMLAKFAEYGAGVSDEVSRLSFNLTEARKRAEAVATEVASRAEELNGLSGTQQQVWNRFRALNEKVQALNQSISTLKRPDAGAFTEEDRLQIANSLKEFESLFEPLIEESVSIRKEAHDLNIKSLESNADSLAQTLQSVREKIRVLDVSAPH